MGELLDPARRNPGPAGIVADMIGEPWHSIDEELECWRRAGRTATLWWRDDDATRPDEALERLLALSTRHGVPVGIAAVPATMQPGLTPMLQRSASTRVLQHGYAHVDHAAREEPGAELGGHRPASVVLAELEQGLSTLSSRFGDHFIPVLVPPWNRIEPSLVSKLRPLGFRGLSCFAPRESSGMGQGLVCSNCHVDPVNWRGGGVFRGVGKCLSALAGHLSARRLGTVDAGEPTGLLTHHLQHDEPLWEFLGELFARLDHSAPVRWLDAGEVFSP